MEKITINDRHEYFVDGVHKVSVTQILKGGGVIDDTWYTPESRERGRHVHEICEYIDKGILDWNSVHPDYKGYATAYLDFIKQANPIWTYIEHKLYNPQYDYCGTLDRCGFLFNGELWIIDIKSGTESKATEMQLAGYTHAAALTGVIKNNCNTLEVLKTEKLQIGALHLRKNGRFKLYPYKYHVGWDGFLKAYRQLSIKERGF